MPSRNGSISLTPRQLELLGLVASGLTIDQAAESVHVAPSSAYNTLSSARTRVGATSVTQLAVMAIERGWLQRDDAGDYTPATG